MYERQNAEVLSALANQLSTGNTSLEDACKLLNTVARFEERTMVHQPQSPINSQPSTLG